MGVWAAAGVHAVCRGALTPGSLHSPGCASEAAPPPGPLLRGRRAGEGENCPPGRTDVVGARFIAPVPDDRSNDQPAPQCLVGAAPRGCPCLPRHRRLAFRSGASCTLPRTGSGPFLG
jgi:hypothetical protein